MPSDIRVFVLWNSSLSVYNHQVSSAGDVRGITVRIRNLSICFLFVLITPGVFADAVLDEATELIGRGQAGAAFALLAPLEPERSGDPEFDYLLGIAALETGQGTRAVFALERVLAVEPMHDLARAEIARAYFLLGERETARREFETVRQSATAPAEALQTIDRYVDLLDRARPPTKPGTTISGYVEASLGYDSNINSATDKKQLVFPVVGPAPIPLDGPLRNLREKENGFAKLSAGVNAAYAFNERWQLIGGAGGFNRLTEAPFSTRDIYGYAGVSMDWNRHRFTVAGTAENFAIDAHTLRNVYGGYGTWTYDINDRSRVNLSVQGTNLQYKNLGFFVAGSRISDARNVDRYVFSVGYDRALRGSTAPLIYTSLYGGMENENNNLFPQHGHDLIGGRISGSAQIPSISPNVRGYVSLNLEHREYHGPVRKFSGNCQPTSPH